jgi:argininosuccinate synthase
MRAALDAYVDKTQERVGGVVRLKLFDGACTVVDARVAATPVPSIIPLAKA